MNPLLNLFLFYLLALFEGADISDGDSVTYPTAWSNCSGFYTYLVPNAIVGTSWVLLGWMLLSSRGEHRGSSAERASH
jgi:hypothetical protein